MLTKLYEADSAGDGALQHVLSRATTKKGNHVCRLSGNRSRTDPRLIAALSTVSWMAWTASHYFYRRAEARQGY